MELNKVYHGNNLEVLKTFPDNSIDSIVTDPPYGINFMNKKWDYDVPTVELWKECLRVLKPGGHILVACGTRTQHRMAINIEDAGFEIRDIIAWVYGSGFPKSHNIGIAIDKINGVDSKIISSGRSGKSSHAFQSEETTTAGEYHVKEAQNKWQGWGTALKPSMELWTLARKQLIGTVAENVLKYGTGGINIDECRIGNEEITTNGKGNMNGNTPIVPQNKDYIGKTHTGRFPANFIHDGSDEVVSLFPNSDGAGGSMPNSKITGYGKNMGDGTYEYYGGDRKVFESGSGSASRFFYTAKASQSERNFGLDQFKEQVVTDGREKSIDNAFNRGETMRKNIHPTVKPIDLMKYLVRLITPKGGVCLDPFLGSGTTAVACKEENFDYIGIELMEEYVKIAKARIDAVVCQLSIFDL